MLASATAEITGEGRLACVWKIAAPGDAVAVVDRRLWDRGACGARHEDGAADVRTEGIGEGENLKGDRACACGEQAASKDDMEVERLPALLPTAVTWKEY